MPTTRVTLGHSKQFYIDGQAVEGARDLQVDVSSRTVDVTGVNASWASTLTTSVDVSVTATLYFGDEVPQLRQNLMAHPRVPMTLSVPNVFSGTFVVTDVRIGVPMGNVIAYDVTFKLWSWGGS